MPHGCAQVEMAKHLLRCNGIAGQLGEDGARATSERVEALPMFLTNRRSKHCDNVIPDVNGVTVVVWEHPTLARLTTLLMPSLEEANNHFQHRQHHINIGLRGAEMTPH